LYLSVLSRFFNVNLIMALRRRRQRWAEMGKGWYQQDISVVLVVVMCVFLICQTPTFIDHILWTVVDEGARTCGYWHYYYTAISDTLAILNSSVNFVIYVLTSRNFRNGLVLRAPFVTANAVVTGVGGSEYIGLQGSRSVLSATVINQNNTATVVVTKALGAGMGVAVGAGGTGVETVAGSVRRPRKTHRDLQQTNLLMVYIGQVT